MSTISRVQCSFSKLACVTFDGQILVFVFSARLVGSFGGDFFENQPGLKEKMYRYNNKCSETDEMHFSSDWQKKKLFVKSESIDILSP